MASAKTRTTDRIKAGLTELLVSRTIEDITATELCAHIKMNRATFYYHYNSVQDVLAEIERQLESEFMQFLSQYTINSDGSPAKSFYVAFFEFVARNVGICKILLGSQNQTAFLQRAMEAGRSKVVSAMTKLYPHCPAAKIDYFYIFVSNGFLGLLNYWLNSGMRESISYIAEIGENVSNVGIGFLKGV